MQTAESGWNKQARLRKEAHPHVSPSREKGSIAHQRAVRMKTWWRNVMPSSLALIHSLLSTSSGLSWRLKRSWKKKSEIRDDGAGSSSRPVCRCTIDGCMLGQMEEPLMDHWVVITRLFESDVIRAVITDQLHRSEHGHGAKQPAWSGV